MRPPLNTKNASGFYADLPGWAYQRPTVDGE
jgi:hypothetical protein